MNFSSPEPPELPKVIGERYELLRLLREEPWGAVWLAQDQLLGVEVALKFLPREVPEAAAAQKVLEQEAALALKLRHPLILGVFHLGQAEEGLFLVQEPFTGESLLAQLSQRQRFSASQALHLLEQVSQALAIAHERGLVHQALNPLQVLTRGDEVRVANFAWPRVESDQALYLELKAYDPPEVLHGEAPSEAGNVFSLGVLGFRLVAGSLPYPLTFDEPFPYRLETPPVDLEEVPLALQNVLLQCLALEPEERFPDAVAFLTQLQRVREQWRPSAKEAWGDWEPLRRRPGWPTAAQAGNLAGRLWEASKFGGKRLGEALAPLGARLRAAPARLWWGLGLAGLVLVLLLVGNKLRSRLAPPPAPVATAPLKLPVVGGGPPLVESEAPLSPPGPEPAARPAATPAVAPAPPAPAPEAKAPPKEERYLVVAATFAREDKAQELKQRLVVRKYQARVVKKTVAGKTRYQVQLGPISGARQAEELARLLKTKERLAPQVQRLPGSTGTTPALKRPGR